MLESRAGDFPVLGYRPRLASRGLLVAVALVTVTIGFLILRGHGLVASGGFVLLVFYLGILVRWQRGVYGLLGYLPFAGVVTLALYPWEVRRYSIPFCLRTCFSWFLPISGFSLRWF